MDELEIWTIKYREQYESEFKEGLRISARKDIDENGCIIPCKYYSLENNKLIEINPNDMFEILYYNVVFCNLKNLNSLK